MRAIERALWLADVLVGVSECPPGSNAGPFIEKIQRITGNKRGDAWCMSFVQYVLVVCWGESHVPLLRSASVQQVYTHALAHGWVVEQPQAGALLCIWHPELTPPRFGHTGFVIGQGLDDGQWCTIEGNVSTPRDEMTSEQLAQASREGWLCKRNNHRTFKPADRFILIPSPAGDTW